MKYKKTLFTLSVGAAGYTGMKYYRNNWLYRGRERLQSPRNSEDCKIIVRIWHPYTKDQVGHASLQVGDHYLSFWPENGVDPSQKEGMVQSCNAIMLTLEEDINAEDDRLPDETFEFIYLDEIKMKDEIIGIKRQISENDIGYCLSGRKLKGDMHCMNCTTAVYRVLTVGGLEALPILDRFITSPQQLRDILVIASKYESADSSLTQSIN
jgi:hypothetical protein